jgi:hypothetical protein
MTRVSRTFAFMFFVAAMAGCSSISTTHLKRNRDSCDWDKTHLCGIPITVDVPDKIKVEVFETLYYHTSPNDDNAPPGNKNVGRVLRNSADNKPIVNRWAQVTAETKKEIFTVDFVKPGAGTLQTSVDLDKDAQYFSEINNTITDETIDAITKAISNVGGALGPLTRGKSAGAPPTTDGNVPNSRGKLKSVQRSVAVGYFDAADRQMVEKIHEFLCKHINGCAPPCAVDGLTAPISPNTGTPIAGMPGRPAAAATQALAPNSPAGLAPLTEVPTTNFPPAPLIPASPTSNRR